MQTKIGKGSLHIYILILVHHKSSYTNTRTFRNWRRWSQQESSGFYLDLNGKKLNLSYIN